MKKTAVIIFIDEEGNILLQERGSYSKHGEKYGYFGGNIQDEENAKEALIRELKEELKFVPKNIKFWKTINFKNSTDENNTQIQINIFIGPLTDEIKDLNVYEGKNKVVTSIDKELSSNNITGGYKIVLAEIKDNFSEVLKLIQ